MKKTYLVSIAILAIVAVAAFNVNLNSQSDKLSAMTLANLEALAQGESDGGLTWKCLSIVIDTYEQSSYSYECGRYYLSAKSITYDCNNGIWSFCYPGYVTTYYNCDGSVSSINDQTSISTGI
jgi:hypothetical protein